MTMIFDDDVGVSFFDSSRQLAEEAWHTDASHILEAYLRSTSLDEKISLLSIVLYGMYG